MRITLLFIGIAILLMLAKKVDEKIKEEHNEVQVIVGFPVVYTGK